MVRGRAPRTFSCPTALFDAVGKPSCTSGPRARVNGQVREPSSSWRATGALPRRSCSSEPTASTPRRAAGAGRRAGRQSQVSAQGRHQLALDSQPGFLIALTQDWASSPPPPAQPRGIPSAPPSRASRRLRRRETAVLTFGAAQAGHSAAVRPNERQIENMPRITTADAAVAICAGRGSRILSACPARPSTRSNAPMRRTAGSSHTLASARRGRLALAEGYTRARVGNIVVVRGTNPGGRTPT